MPCRQDCTRIDGRRQAKQAFGIDRRGEDGCRRVCLPEGGGQLAQQIGQGAGSVRFRKIDEGKLQPDSAEKIANGFDSACRGQ